MPDLGLRELALRDLPERKLHGVVSVDVLRLDLDDRTRPGLDDGDRRHLPESGSKTWLMPSFLPRMPFISELDLDVDAGR